MARKRADGEGTIAKRSDGRYTGAAFVPVSGGGRRRVFVYGRTRDEVRGKLDDLMRQADDGIPRARERQTVAAYLDYWLEHVVRPEKRATTYNGYESTVRLHIVPVIGRKKLAELGPADVRRLLPVLREKEISGSGGGLRRLSDRMIQSAHAILRNALSNAVREELIGRNVAKFVQVSNPEYDVGVSLGPVAARTLLARISDDRLFALYLCAIVRGMRRGELLGLGWDAVDLDAGKLVVRQSLTWANGRVHLGPPKSRASRRVVPLPPTVVDALREHRERQDADREIAGDRWTETGLVFTSPLGGHVSPRTLAAQWHVIRTAAGLGRMRFHDLRHTAVSLLLALGVPPHVVREIVGHSDVKVTMTVYAHGNLDEKAAALSQLSTAVTGGLLSPVVVNEDQADLS